ncbi:MAG: heparan-alpha-glucosaminide N-acetyltransferase [Rhodobacteraceae bacterium]|nr:heparan-alpha-glucosaminide N-acetyltransferase [Paracoccaceae bacterium]MCY4326907.1 heparan-alpha-glucosaminide N-acetyltransferase [Paracoccaceae bacterium]
MDGLRGLALLGMIFFHCVWDLEFFGLLAPATTDLLVWRVFAASVAASFLFVAGVSLCLAHAHRIHWRPWARRLAILTLAALAITAITRVITPDEYIRFGILHMIAAASLLGLVVLRVPVWLTAAAAAAILVINHQLSSDFLDPALWEWTGFGGGGRGASDFRPIVPWLAPALLGIAAAQFCQQRDLLPRLATWQLESRAAQLLRDLGRHSLLVYLVHQPILFAAIWAGLQVMS